MSMCVMLWVDLRVSMALVIEVVDWMSRGRRMRVEVGDVGGG